MVREGSSTDKPQQPESFAAALARLIAAGSGYLNTTKDEDALERLHTLYIEVQLAALPSVTLPPFRREIWPLEEEEFGPVSLDFGRTWKLEPHHRRLQGRWSACCEWIEEFEKVAAAVARQIEAASKERSSTAAKKKSRPKRRKKQQRPLTARQTEVAQLVSDCKGDLDEAAKQLGISRQSVERQFHAAMEKVGERASKVIKTKTVPLPHDRRGQANISKDDESE